MIIKSVLIVCGIILSGLSIYEENHRVRPLLYSQLIFRGV